MPTLRDMLIEIYQPRRGIIEFPQGPDEGGNALAVLGNGAGMGGSQKAAERGGSVPTGSVGGFTGASDDGLRDLGFGFIGGDEFGGAAGRLQEVAKRAAGERDSMGFSGEESEFPGRYDLVNLLAQLLPGPMSAVATMGNSIEGLKGLDRFVDRLGAISGTPTEADIGDIASAMTGLNLSPRARGVGGYGNLGAGGIENAIELEDPGVMGPARGMGRTLFDSSRGQDPDLARQEAAFSGYDISSGFGGAPASPGFSGSSFDRGRDGGSGGGSAEGGRGGGNVGDTPGERGPGGRNTFHSGGHLSEDMVPGMERGDVPITAQEGEYVVTADAVEMFGPEFYEGLNNLARMMKQFHPGQATMHDGGRVKKDYY